MKKLFFPFILLLTASAIFTGCRTDDPTPEPDPPPIVVTDEATLNQTVFANEKMATPVSFTTLASWTATVAERTTQSTRNAAPTWVTIAVTQGKMKLPSHWKRMIAVQTAPL